ncbi:MAG: hypothetical protein L0Z50_24250 [Verrucomicrobiales bacterium]|nr:hypothetical protein [Verrucomicrobiales bacterium]
MNRQLLPLILTVLICPLTPSLKAKPSATALIGKWNAVIEFSKFKIKMNLKIAPAEDGKRIQATMDIPEQGAKDLPVSALLFNSPAVRLEIDQFRTAFNGNLSEDGNSISGQFEEGPEGRPFEVVFKRNTEPDKPEPAKTYTFATGEPPDLRGYWTTSLEAMPGMVLRLGLRIGRLPDGSFNVLLDSFDQGASDIPASSASYSDGSAKIEWELMRVVFESKLSADGKELAGTWKQGPKGIPVKFERLAKPATALPDGISFVPEKGSPEDIRGHWKGSLEVRGNKLRLALKLGKLPDGSFSGTMASLDQGGRDLPVSSVGYTNPVVRMEWKGIRGVYTGTVNKEGTEMTGTWEQWGSPSPLSLQRVESAEAAAKP